MTGLNHGLPTTAPSQQVSTNKWSTTTSNYGTPQSLHDMPIQHDSNSTGLSRHDITTFQEVSLSPSIQ